MMFTIQELVRIRKFTQYPVNAAALLGHSRNISRALMNPWGLKGSSILICLSCWCVLPLRNTIYSFRYVFGAMQYTVERESLANWLCSSLWWKKVWRINRTANRLFIVSTNLDDFGLANHGWFAKLSRYTVCIIQPANVHTYITRLAAWPYHVENQSFCTIWIVEEF